MAEIANTHMEVTGSYINMILFRFLCCQVSTKDEFMQIGKEANQRDAEKQKDIQVFKIHAHRSAWFGDLHVSIN
jgi:hypothetical protein